MKEVGSCVGDPAEEVISGTSLEDEHGDRLLENETDDDGLPLDNLAVARAGEVDALENKETEDRDGPLAVCRTGRELEAIGRSGDETSEGDLMRKEGAGT